VSDGKLQRSVQACTLPGGTGWFTAAALGSGNSGELLALAARGVPGLPFPLYTLGARARQFGMMLDGHPAAVRALAFSPEARTLASAGDDGVIRLWDTVYSDQGAVLEGHKGGVRALVWPLLGPLVSAGESGGVRRWIEREIPLMEGETRDPTRLETYWDFEPLEGLPPHPRALAISADGAKLAVGGAEGELVLSDAGAAIVLGTEPGAVAALAFDPAATRLAVACGDLVRVRRLTPGAAGGVEVRLPTDATSLAFGANGLLAVGDAGGGVQLLSADGRPRWRREPGAAAVDRVAWSAASERFAWGSGELAYSLDLGAPELRGGAARATWSEPDRELLLSDDRTTVVMRDGAVATGTVRPDPVRDGRVLDAVRSSRGHVIVGSEFGLAAYSPEGFLIRRFEGHHGGVGAVACAPDGRYLVSGSRDGTVRLWELPTREERAAVIGVALSTRLRAKIEHVFPGLPGERAGLQPGDVILAVGGEPVRSTADYDRLLAGVAVGQTLKLQLERPRQDALGLRTIGGTPFEVELQTVPAPDTVQPLVSLYAPSDRRWVAWLNDGWYTGSRDADKLLTWVVNQDLNQTATTFDASVVAKDFRRPDLLRQLLEAPAG
jgi:WD40 repeat protein